MLDKDKLLIIAYINVQGITDLTIPEILGGVAKRLEYDESVNTIIVPTRFSETRIECINPVLLTDEQYQETRDKLEKLTEQLKELIKFIK